MSTKVKIARPEMKRISLLMLGLALLFDLACTKSVPKTSLGDLVRVEKKEQIVTGDAGIIKPKAEETLYLLNFEGKNVINYEPGAKSYYPLVDSSGRRYSLLYAGSPQGDGKLSGDAWKLDGQATAVADGQFSFSGTATLPEPKVVFVYAVPTSATGLALRDGDQTFPLD